MADRDKSWPPALKQGEEVHMEGKTSFLHWAVGFWAFVAAIFIGSQIMGVLLTSKPLGSAFSPVAVLACITVLLMLTPVGWAFNRKRKWVLTSQALRRFDRQPVPLNEIKSVSAYFFFVVVNVSRFGRSFQLGGVKDAKTVGRRMNEAVNNHQTAGSRTNGDR